MSLDFAIDVQDLSKCYQIYDTPQDRLLQMLLRNRKRFYREFWALKALSLQVAEAKPSVSSAVMAAENPRSCSCSAGP